MVHVGYPDAGDQPAATAGVHPQEPTGACRCDTESWAAPGGEILVVRVSGELDLLSRPVLTVALLEALSRGPRHLVVDLGATTFCCLRGYEVLAETAFVAGARGIEFAVTGLTAHQDKVLGLSLPAPGPVRHRSVAAAVAAILARSHPAVRGREG